MSEELALIKVENERLKERVKRLGREKANLQMAVNLINEIASKIGLDNVVNHILQILVGAIGGSNIAIYYETEDRWKYTDILGCNNWMDEIDDKLVKESVENKIFLKMKENEESKLTITGFPQTYETWVYPLQVHGAFFGAVKLQGMAIEHAHYRDNIDPFIQYAALILYHEVSNLKKLTKAYQKVKKARKEAELKKEQFELAMEFANDGLFDWNLVSSEIYYSPGWKRMLGYEDNELPNDFSVWETLTDPEDVKRSWKMQNELINRKRDHFELEFKMKHKNGHWVDILSRANVIFDENNKAVRIIGTHVDISERKKLETQLRQAQKMESVGRLAGGVAHDFNNMLGVILGHTELALLQADENHDLFSGLKEIQAAAMRSANITKQLLAFARKQTISPKQLDLNDTVESMLNMLHRLIGEDIDLVWQPAAQIWSVKMDPSQLDQILANLCINARDAIAGVGKLTIETERKSFDGEYCKQHAGFTPGDFVLLTVSDNGCGMDKDTQSNLFEPFFTTKEVGKGTGLGLATVYGIVKQNNGFINVYSEPGKGSTFKIYLPRFCADEDIVKTVPKKNESAGGTETILLVEDEPSILRMTRMMLERKGYSVLPAATPGEAIDLAKTHSEKIHLLMTDVVMPEMNGRDLAAQIIELCPGIRLLFMSGYTADVIAHHGVLDAGVAFIQKPFSMADLMVKVREVMVDQI
ncbi:MAG: PAS domain-containing protein [Desulfamplus sp.]|nr:PAS domain-containing protein [Desulfamplus sp.]